MAAPDTHESAQRLEKPRQGAARKQRAAADAVLPARPRIYHADAFALALPEEGWRDQTVFILAGPTTDGLQHNVVVTVDPEPGIEMLQDYGDWQVRSMKEELSGCRVLREDRIQLDSGWPAYRAVYRWEPSPERCTYQEQLYVLQGGTGYKLTATFTKKTRKTMGPQVERIMRSFEPKSYAQT